MSSLHKEVTKLAHANPELRKHLVPLLKQADFWQDPRNAEPPSASLEQAVFKVMKASLKFITQGGRNGYELPDGSHFVLSKGSAKMGLYNRGYTVPAFISHTPPPGVKRYRGSSFSLFFTLSDEDVKADKLTSLGLWAQLDRGREDLYEKNLSVAAVPRAVRDIAKQVEMAVIKRAHKKAGTNPMLKTARAQGEVFPRVYAEVGLDLVVLWTSTSVAWLGCDPGTSIRLIKASAKELRTTVNSLLPKLGGNVILGENSVNSSKYQGVLHFTYELLAPGRTFSPETQALITQALAEVHIKELAFKG